MATSAKKDGNNKGYKKAKEQQKPLSYTIGDKFDLYKMTGLQKPQRNKENH